jgi:hypothetical protein
MKPLLIILLLASIGCDIAPYNSSQGVALRPKPPEPIEPELTASELVRDALQTGASIGKLCAMTVVVDSITSMKPITGLDIGNEVDKCIKEKLARVNDAKNM